MDELIGPRIRCQSGKESVAASTVNGVCLSLGSVACKYDSIVFFPCDCLVSF